MEEYNKVASLMDWKQIDSPTTVENWRQKFALTTMVGNKGDKALKNTRMKQIHREAPTLSLIHISCPYANSAPSAHVSLKLYPISGAILKEVVLPVLLSLIHI